MNERILISGSGGQGVIFIGRLLAAAALEQVRHITFFPAYGVEVRGGTSNCQVILSSAEIASPVAEAFESMILMNQDSVERFSARLGKDGLMILNGSMCQPSTRADVHSIRATELALGMGNGRVANLIMLGSYAARRTTIPVEAIEKEILQANRKDPAVAELNLTAFRLGLRHEP